MEHRSCVSASEIGEGIHEFKKRVNKASKSVLADAALAFLFISEGLEADFVRRMLDRAKKVAQQRGQSASFLALLDRWVEEW